MVHGERDKSVTFAAGLAIAAAVMGVIASRTWGAEQAEPRATMARSAVALDRAGRRMKEAPRPQRRQASPGGIFDTPERTGVYFATGVKVPVEVKWKFVGQGDVDTAPVIRDDRVYVGGGAGIYCLKLATGEEVWRSEYSCQGALTVANGALYAYAGKLRPPQRPLSFVALDARSGRELWSVGGRLSFFRPPVAGEGVVYFGGEVPKDGVSLFCVDAKTGRELWHKPGIRGSPAGHGPVYTRNRVYAAFLYCLSALDRRNGKEVWSSRSVCLGLSPVVDGRIFASFRNDSASPPRWVEALDAATGKTLWKFQPRGHVETNPVAWDGNVFFGDQVSGYPEEGPSGNFYVLDAATGKLKWQFHSPKGPFRQSPVVADGVVYTFNEDGYLRAFDITNGSLLWQFQGWSRRGCTLLPCLNIQAPGVADGLVLFRGEAGLYALGPAETKPSPGDLPQEPQPEPSSPQGPARPAPGLRGRSDNTAS